MRIRTFNDMYRAMRSSALRDNVALQALEFAQHRADMLEMRPGDEQPVRIIRRSRLSGGQPTKILICESHKGSETLVEYGVIKFKSGEGEFGLDGAIVTNASCDRFWLGLAALKHFAICKLSYELKNLNLPHAQTESVVMIWYRRMIYRILDKRLKGEVSAIKLKSIKAGGLTEDEYVERVLGHLCIIAKEAEPPSLSQMEYRTRGSLLLDTARSAWNLHVSERH